jgi:ribosome-associated protein
MSVLTVRGIQIPLAEFHFAFARSSGPGGQNVNKVNSKATLRWSVVASPNLSENSRNCLLASLRPRLTVGGELVISSQRYRDAGRNVADCLEKLRDLLAEATRPVKPRRPTRPTKGSAERRLSGKRLRADKKRLRGSISPE